MPWSCEFGVLAGPGNDDHLPNIESMPVHEVGLPKSQLAILGFAFEWNLQ